MISLKTYHVSLRGKYYYVFLQKEILHIKCPNLRFGKKKVSFWLLEVFWRKGDSKLKPDKRKPMKSYITCPKVRFGRFGRQKVMFSVHLK